MKKVTKPKKIMDYIRNSWNRNLSKEDFISGISDSSELVNIAHCLLEICGENDQPSKLFLDYLNALFDNTTTCREVFLHIDKHNSNGILLLIIEKGNELFQDFEISNLISAECAKNALFTCINPKDELLAKNAIQRLSESPVFCILIASARVYFPDEIHEIGISVKNLIPDNPSIPDTLPFPMTLLKHALLSEPKVSSFLFQRHELGVIIISNLIINSSVPSSFSFLDIHTFCHLYLHCVTTYLSNPSLQLSYLVTNLLVRIFNKISNNSEDLSQDLYSENDLQSLLEIIQTMKTVDPISEQEDRENCDFLNKSTNYNMLLSQLISTSSLSMSGSIINDSIRFPSLSSTLVDRLLQKIQSSNISDVELAKQLSEHNQDLLMLLLMQHKFLNFLQVLFNVAINIQSTSSLSEFTSYWYFALSLLRAAWGLGWDSLRKEINSFIDDQFENNLQLFLKQFLDPKVPQSFSPPFHQKTYFNEVIEMLSQLNGNEQYPINDQKKPLHYLSIILTGLRSENPRSFIDMLIDEHLPDIPVIQIMFTQLLIRVSPAARSYLTACSKPDYEAILTASQPESIDLLSPILLSQFDTISRTNQLTNQDALNIITTWNAWTHQFTFPIFCRELINKLIWKTSHAFVPDDASNLFQFVASILAIQINGNSEYIDQALNTAYEIVINGVDSTATCSYLALFSLVIICTCDGNWEERFNLLLQRCCDLLLNEHSNPSISKEEIDFFSLTVIRTALSTPKLQSIMPESIIDALLAAGDTRTTIDYLIVKSQTTQE